MADSPQDDFDRGKLYVGPAAASRRLQRRAGRAAEPAAAWPARSCKLRVSTEPRELAMTDPTLFHYHLVFMHGRHDFPPDAEPSGSS